MTKGFARKLRRHQTDAELKLWQHLRARRLLGFKFRRQHPIPPFIVDFCCPEQKLVIELDGSQHVSQRTADERRTRYLEEQGYRFLRFWDNELLIETDSVLEMIRLALTDPHPNPLPKREREKERAFPSLSLEGERAISSFPLPPEGERVG